PRPSSPAPAVGRLPCPGVLAPAPRPFLLLLPPPPRSTLFPYTTLFRSTVVYPPISNCTCTRTITWSSPIGSCGGSAAGAADFTRDRKSTRLNSSHGSISYAVFCLKKKNHATFIDGTKYRSAP